MHTISSLCMATGLNPATVRTWERRYGVPHASRSENGRRRYSDAEVERLQLVAELIRSGATIRDVVHLSTIEATDLLNRRREIKASVHTEYHYEVLLERANLAMRQGDIAALRQVVGLGRATLAPLPFIACFLTPMMRSLGDMWACGEIPVGLEHAVTAVVRHVIYGSVAPPIWEDTRGAFLICSAEGEQHEFGALFSWYLANSRGVKAIYLGANMPTDELLPTMELFNASTILVSSIQKSNHADLTDRIVQLIPDLPASAEIWIGHPHRDGMTVPRMESLRSFSTYPDFYLAIWRRFVTEIEPAIGMST